MIAVVASEVFAEGVDISVHLVAAVAMTGTAVVGFAVATDICKHYVEALVCRDTG